jgi:hypothetical protein
MRGRNILVAFGAASILGLYATPAEAGKCRDAWITSAIWQVAGREPNGDYESGECTYTQYGGGRWSSYAELKGYVEAKLKPKPAPPAFGGSLRSFSTDNPTFANSQASSIRINKGFVQMWAQDDRGRYLFKYDNKWWLYGGLVGNDGASIIGNDSAGILSNANAGIIGNDSAGLKAIPPRLISNGLPLELLRRGY